MIQGGKSFVSCAPSFSNDAKKLLVCTGNTVSIFSTSTGMLIAELVGHNALVTSVTLVPSTSKVFCFCWTSSLDGTIRYWDFSVPELVKTYDVRLPIFSMVIPSLIGKQELNDQKKADVVVAYISVEDLNGHKEKPKSSPGQIRKCNLTKKSGLAGGVILAETAYPVFLTVSPSGRFFGMQNKRSTNIWMIPDNDRGHAIPKRMKLHHTKQFSALAFHPTERIVAAGDVTGRILVWRGFGARTFSGDELIDGNFMKNEDDRPGVRGDDDAESCSTWHWHSDEVKFLSFSSDGAYLYSGGNEGVLVLWQIDTGKKKFLPRIGSPLLYFVDSPDPLLSSVSCADNRILLLKMPSLEILKSISGIKLPSLYPDIWNGSSGGFVFDQAAGLVCLRTENYCIQFYSLLDNCEISEVQVCERNHQPADDITMVVNLIALSPDGFGMCTAETRLAEDGVGGLVCLKFWACVSEKKDFKLSTIVYEPHRDAAISAIAYHPACHMVASASCGGDFKVWVQGHTIQEKGTLENTGWTCHAVGSYKRKPMTSAAFSADGSVLAVAAETVITLWDPERNYLVAVIGESLMPIHNLSFVGNSNYLLSASQGSRPELSVWNLSTLSLAWSYKLQVHAIACMDTAMTFAVLAHFPDLSKNPVCNGSAFCSIDGIILIFNADDPHPVATWSVTKAKGGGLVFLQANKVGFTLPGDKPSVLLAYINSDHEYVVFDPYGKDTTRLNLTHQNGGVEDETEQFGYTALYGELPKFEPKMKSDDLSILPSEKPWETMFDGPSHSLPPLNKLCSAFLESLLEKRTSFAE